MGIKRRKIDAGIETRRVYVDLDFDAVVDACGGEEAFFAQLRARHPDMDDDAIEDMLDNSNDVELVEDHPWVSLKANVKLGDLRLDPKQERRVRNLVRRASSGTDDKASKAAEDGTWALCLQIADAGGDWGLSLDPFNGRKEIAKWSSLPMTERARILISMGSETASLLFSASTTTETISEDVLGNSGWQSPSPTTSMASTTAPNAP